MIGFFSLLLVVIGWYVTGIQNRNAQKRQQLIQYREALKMLSKEDLSKFLDNPSNMQRLILQNKVEMEKRTLLSFFPQYSLIKFYNPLKNKISDKFNSLIEHIDEKGQSLFTKEIVSEKEKEIFLVRGNRIILDIIELISSTKKAKIPTKTQP